MSNFKVGQKVVCINIEGNTSLVKNKIYIIKGLHKCPKCEEPLLDVNSPATTYMSMCGACKYIDEAKGFWRSSRFRPIKEQPSKISNVIDNKQVIKELATEKSDVKIKEKV